MAEKHLHLISFNIPFPADYGGVIDIFYKIKALKQSGVKVILHCFQYGRNPSPELESLCEKVYYYPRKKRWTYVLYKTPYIVLSRNSESLVKNLLKDQHPVLFEGLHDCYSLNDSRLKGRLKMVRMHNIEHDYYAALAVTEKNYFKRVYFKAEAKKLKSFEINLKSADYIFAISPEDTKDLSERYSNVLHLPPFHSFEAVISQSGKGDYALYHGNLGIGENNKAALFLVNEVFNDTKIPLVIAGNDPSGELQNEVNQYKHIHLKANASTLEIEELVKNAQINILPTFQSTGIKLKLLTALFNGRHCLVNSLMVNNTGLESLCSVKDSPADLKAELMNLMNRSFDESEKKKREDILEEKFSNRKNIKKLLQLLP